MNVSTLVFEAIFNGQSSIILGDGLSDKSLRRSQKKSPKKLSNFHVWRLFILRVESIDGSPHKASCKGGFVDFEESGFNKWADKACR